MDEWAQNGAIWGGVGSEVLVAWGQALEWAQMPSEGVSFYVNDFLLSQEKPWRQYPHFARLSWSEWQNWTSQQPAPEKGAWFVPEQKEFETQFEDIQSAIQTSSLEKAVPVMFESSKQRLFANPMSLMKTPPKNTFLYGAWTSSSGFFGYTPEMLFDLKNSKELTTMALAGTSCHVDLTERASELLSSKKELAEHQYVVEDLKKKLSFLGDISVGELEVLHLSSLSHLKTPLHLALKNPVSSLEPLIQKLHPTAALGVYPESEASFLKVLRQPGEFLGAPFGVRLDSNAAQVAVGIRQLQWQQDQLLVGAGCGIVKGSDVHKEWQELKSKREFTKKSLGL